MQKYRRSFFMGSSFQVIIRPGKVLRSIRMHTRDKAAMEIVRTGTAIHAERSAGSMNFL